MTIVHRIRKRWIALCAAVLAIVVLVAAYGVVHNTSERRCRLTAALSPTCGAWWGAALDVADSALPASVQRREAETGRRMDIVHAYHRWSDSFPTAAERAVATSGRLLFLNWEPVTASGTAMPWSAIARGDHDGTIRQTARRLAALDRPVLVSFSHEPELDWGTHGGASDFAAAYRHVVELSRTAGASNVRWVWNVMGLTDEVWQHRYRQMWPGAHDVDWIAWDPYNFASCRQQRWRTFAEIVRPFYSWLQQSDLAGKPLMLAEFGTIEGADTDGGKAHWLRGIPAAMADFPALRALVYFDLPAPPASCDWQLTTSPAAQRAYADVAGSRPFRWTATQRPSG